MTTDELTGVQALEPTHSDLTTAPGQVRRREFEHLRLGTFGFGGRSPWSATCTCTTT